MSDVLRAMSISGGILLAVVILVVIISMAAVKRGEIQMHEEAKRGGSSGGRH